MDATARSSSCSIGGMLEATAIGPDGQRTLHSFLADGMVELYKNRPTNPVDAANWLAEWMENNNPVSGKAKLATANQLKEGPRAASRDLADKLEEKLSAAEVVPGDDPSVVRSAADSLASSNPFVVFVLGGPGCGKGTNCARISKEFRFVHLSTGDLLRDEVKKGSEIGREAKAIMEQGLLLDDSIVLRLLKKAMTAAVVEGKESKFLVDGYPRSLEQAHMFEKEICPVSLVLYFDASDAAMTERILERGKTSGRVDDNIETIGKRLRTFHDCTEPAVKFYSRLEKLRRVPAGGTLDDVYRLAQAVFQPAALEAVHDLNLFEKERDPFLPLCGGRDKLSVVFVLGGPGCGKGTNCSRISHDFGYVHLSTGDLLREEVARGSQIGLEAKAIMEQGGLIGDDIVLKLLEQAMTNAISEGKGTRFLIDGYPRLSEGVLLGDVLLAGRRSLEQALLFERTVCPVDFVLYFEASDAVMTERILERGKTSGRVDDNAETIKKRLETFHACTEPALNFYDSISRVRRVCAHGSLDEVYDMAKTHFFANVLCVVGGQGSGKRAVAKILQDNFGYKVVYVADRLRGTPDGRAVVDRGDVADASLVGPLVVAELTRLYRTAGGSANFVVVGYPRTHQQMSFLKEKFSGNYQILNLRFRKLGDLVSAATKSDSVRDSSFSALHRAAENIHSGPEMHALLERYGSITTSVVLEAGSINPEKIVTDCVKPKLTIVAADGESDRELAETLARADEHMLMSADKVVDAEISRATLIGRRMRALREAQQAVPIEIVAHLLCTAVVARPANMRAAYLMCQKDGLIETVAAVKEYFVVDRIIIPGPAGGDGRLIRTLRDVEKEDIVVVSGTVEEIAGKVASGRLPESILLLGLPCVGKSGVAEALAERINGSFVASLKGAAESISESLGAGIREALDAEGPGIEKASDEVKAALMSSFVASRSNCGTVIFDGYPGNDRSAAEIFGKVTRSPKAVVFLEGTPELIRARAEKAFDGDFDEEAFEQAQAEAKKIQTEFEEHLKEMGVRIEHVNISDGNPITKGELDSGSIAETIVKRILRPSTSLILSNLGASKVIDIVNEAAPYGTSVVNGSGCVCSSSLVTRTTEAKSGSAIVCGYLEQAEYSYPTARDLLDNLKAVLPLVRIIVCKVADDGSQGLATSRLDKIAEDLEKLRTPTALQVVNSIEDLRSLLASA